MPTYLYKHTAPDALCGREEFEEQQSIKEEALIECPQCGTPVKRLIAGGVAVTWKNGAPTPKNY